MKYKLWFRSGRAARQANSMRAAPHIARQALGVKRVYRGAQYATDEPAAGGERRAVDALDLWTSRRAASSQRADCADCVITW